MTRINVSIRPEALCDQHLMAEYRELPRVFTLSARHSRKNLPKKFTLGKGHIMFFYDKIYFLVGRYRDIVLELVKRGYSINEDMVASIYSSGLDQAINTDLQTWLPTPEAHAILCVRLKERLNSMYKITYYGQPISASEAFSKISYSNIHV